MIGTMLHEGLGHCALALLTGATSGTLSTVAWSSVYDSRLVAAGGTLVNLAAGVIFLFALKSARNASAATRFFLLIACAFNLFTGTGYFFFSGVTNFGDWAQVIAGMHPYWLLRMLLILGGMAAYFEAMRVIATSLVRYLGVPRTDHAALSQADVDALFCCAHHRSLSPDYAIRSASHWSSSLLFLPPPEQTARRFSLSTTFRNQPSPAQQSTRSAKLCLDHNRDCACAVLYRGRWAGHQVQR